MPINYKEYPADWKQIRERILKRAGNKCEICKVPNGDLIVRGKWNGVECWQDQDGRIYNLSGEFIGETYVGDLDGTGRLRDIKIVLTVAHLDNNPTNHDVTDDRLMALCQLHHLRLDSEHHMKNRRVTMQKKKGQLKLF